MFGEVETLHPPTTDRHGIIWTCPLMVTERVGVKRVNEPVAAGIPFPQGTVHSISNLVVLNGDNESIPRQIQPLSLWPDGSVQWGLVEFFASVPAFSQTTYQLLCSHNSDTDQDVSRCAVKQEASNLIVDTGAVKFTVNSTVMQPFRRIEVSGCSVLSDRGSAVVFVDDRGERYEPTVSVFKVETNGPIRTTVYMEGAFEKGSHRLARFFARMSFYAESGFVEMRFTIRNDRAAQHPGGLWDLGDEGSIYFSEISLELEWPKGVSPTVKWRSEPHSPSKTCAGCEVEIYQDSSGGENWRSSNHMNKHGEIPQSFCGYRVSSDGDLVEEGKRATPTMYVESDTFRMGGGIERFWENFPKGLTANDAGLRFNLFPKNFGGGFELQGGEQKTHNLFWNFTSPAQEGMLVDWGHGRLILRSTPEWYADSGALKYVTPRLSDANTAYCQLIDSIIDGENTFFDRREIIDEYGWRNFGEVYADHETIGHQGDSPLVSHYNNQYDVVYGLIVEFLRTGDDRWFALMQDLARHVIDIDIYHTEQDRPSYNGGLFWHSDHYCDAGTATHRTYSRRNVAPQELETYGGGPSNEQNYTSGLLHYYFLAGDPLAREAVVGLANWVVNMDRGVGGLLGWLDRRPKGGASATVDREYHGPGRGAANSINTLLDAYRLTNDDTWLLKAEELIRRCIHPHDRIEAHNFSDIENRWSYTVFLQILGKYLDFKSERQELDYMFSYSRASLLHYADWMLNNEVPYRQVFDRVKKPTETWPAQDLRKSNVMQFAAKYGESSQRFQYREKADFFFQVSISDLLTFSTCRLTRPLVLLLVNGYMHAYFQQHPEEVGPTQTQQYDFGHPKAFIPQLNEVYKLKEWISSALTSRP